MFLNQSKLTHSQSVDFTKYLKLFQLPKSWNVFYNKSKYGRIWILATTCIIHYMAILEYGCSVSDNVVHEKYQWHVVKWKNSNELKNWIDLVKELNWIDILRKNERIELNWIELNWIIAVVEQNWIELVNCAHHWLPVYEQQLNVPLSTSVVIICS